MTTRETSLSALQWSEPASCASGQTAKWNQMLGGKHNNSRVQCGQEIERTECTDKSYDGVQASADKSPRSEREEIK